MLSKSKDFTDWNGPLRKSRLMEPPERATHSGPPRREKKAGIKVKTDRYAQALKDFYHSWSWYREHRYGWATPWRRRSVAQSIKVLRKLKEQYKREGILNDIRIRVGGIRS